MSQIPQDLKYTKDHEWLRDLGGGLAAIGITQHAQDQLGDVVYVDLPAVGSSLESGQTFGTVESVKAVSDLYAPVSGKVVEVNPKLTDAPETVNSDPYGEAWMLKVQLASASELDGLMSAADYAALVK